MNEECGKATQRDSKAGDSTTANLAPISTFKKNKKQQSKVNSKQSGGSKCSHCGSGYHSYEELEDKTKCPAHGQTCGACNKQNHLDTVCRSRFRKKDNNEAEADLISLLQIFTAPEVCSNTTTHPFLSGR